MLGEKNEDDKIKKAKAVVYAGIWPEPQRGVGLKGKLALDIWLYMDAKESLALVRYFAPSAEL